MKTTKRVLATLIVTSGLVLSGTAAHAEGFAPPLKDGGPDLFSLIGHLTSRLSYIL
ncbi:hypothetical protein [Streptomyces sp. NPDC004284]|uniref:hypothetical protein n=1 Tax=Streptomyces sp. NPDC004284 TaxID=3364695 RepID=UPI0036CE8D3B